MSESRPTDARGDVDLVVLERSLRHPRTLLNAALNGLTGVMTVIACVPLFAVLLMLLYRGGKALTLGCFVELPPVAFETGGGFGNAIVGTLLMVGIAVLWSVPVGIMAAIFLAFLGAESRLAAVVRFCAKTLSGFPSILAGVFAFVAVVMLTGTKSAPAGGMALSILMLPIVMLTAEEAIRMVPTRMTSAAFGMGCTRTQVIWKIMIPTAFPGILTGVMLSVARAAGETAPLLFTALSSNYWVVQNGHFQLMKPTASLAVLIYNFSYGSPYESQHRIAWAAALVLVLLVLGVNVGAQLIGRRRLIGS